MAAFPVAVTKQGVQPAIGFFAGFEIIRQFHMPIAAFERAVAEYLR